MVKSLNPILVLLVKVRRKLFQWLFGWFFSLLYAPNKVIEVNQLSSVCVRKVPIKGMDSTYQIYSVRQGKLFTDRREFIAVSHQRFLVSGASWQWKKGIILPPEENPVLLKGTPLPPFLTRKSVLSLLTGGSGNYNYYHWLYDVLPRIPLCECWLNIDDIDFYLVPDLCYRFQNETLDLLNMNHNKLLSSAKVQHLRAENLIVTDHPNPDFEAPPRWILDWLRGTFLPKANLDQKFNKRIYIERGDSVNGRRLLNEEEVYAFLEKEGFSRYRLSELSVIEQISLFNSAEIIVGVHGAGFANLTFSRPSATVIELFSRDYKPMVYQRIASYNGLTYLSLVAEYIEVSETSLTANFSISLEMLTKKLLSLTHVSRS